MGSRTRLVEDESKHVAWYIGGLNESIQEKVEMNFIWSLNEAINLAFLGGKTSYDKFILGCVYSKA